MSGLVQGTWESLHFDGALAAYDSLNGPFKKNSRVERYFWTGPRSDNVVTRAGYNENEIEERLHYRRCVPGDVHAALHAANLHLAHPQYGGSVSSPGCILCASLRIGLFLRKFIRPAFVAATTTWEAIEDSPEEAATVPVNGHFGKTNPKYSAIFQSLDDSEHSEYSSPRPT
jgi:hypothetical protein